MRAVPAPFGSGASNPGAALLFVEFVVVDLNADVGEGFADDSALFLLVTSVNVACGFHAGDAQTMRAVCTAAAAAGASIGAHVSYRDRDGFGRRTLAVDAATVAADVAEQIEALQVAAASAGGRVGYVKPHGALYHRASGDSECAEAVVAATAGAGQLAVLGWPGSALLAHARDAGLPAVAEGFADRAYAADGTLVPRTDPGSMLTADAAAGQAVALAEGRLGAPVRSICVHGDTAGAAVLAAGVRDALVAAHIELRAFA
jgi:5-oxoprolinase (ATP-hydrolysing) subunit A